MYLQSNKAIALAYFFIFEFYYLMPVEPGGHFVVHHSYLHIIPFARL